MNYELYIILYSYERFSHERIVNRFTIIPPVVFFSLSRTNVYCSGIPLCLNVTGWPVLRWMNKLK